VRADQAARLQRAPRAIIVLVSRTVIVLWVQSGCPACHSFRPTFNRLAARYRGQVPVYVLDCNDPKNQELADRCGVKATPKLCALRQPYGICGVEGDVGEAEAERIFKVAYAYR